MRTLASSRARRFIVLAVALTAALALFGIVAPSADAAKPDQILDAQVRSVNQITCEVTIDTVLNRKGSMKNDIRVTVFGDNGFEQTLTARRGVTLRIQQTLGAPGVFTGQVASVDRNGEVTQAVPLGSITCGV